MGWGAILVFLEQSRLIFSKQEFSEVILTNNTRKSNISSLLNMQVRLIFGHTNTLVAMITEWKRTYIDL